MEISVRNVPSKIKLRTVRSVVNFCDKEIFSRQLSENISLKIIFDKEVCEKAYGRIYHFHDEYPPRTFEIYLNPIYSRDDIICTIPHEMAHMHQHATLRWYFYERDEGMTRWKTRKYKFIQNNDKPWEIEAYAVEDRIIAKLKHLEETDPVAFNAL
jgi:hypothetical protein